MNFTYRRNVCFSSQVCYIQRGMEVTRKCKLSAQYPDIMPARLENTVSMVIIPIENYTTCIFFEIGQIVW